MYLCNYNQKNVRKNTFLWAIGKIPLFMRFFIMFMFMSIGISYAETVHSQNAAMEFRFQDVTIEKALKEIEKKTGYNFFYNTKDFNVKQKISFSAKGMNLSEVLNGIFANSQVDYVINGTDIVLKRREEVSNVSNEKYQIKGTVRDGNGEPVIGASVVLKGHTETGVITDIDGNFVLTVPAKKVTLSISYIGYDPVNVEATVGTFVKVVMKESSQTLNEVVVVGYGTQKKESVVGSVQMVKPDELKVPSSQLSTGFAGRLAGVVAVQRSGEPGADGADFWIRGISTFNGTRSPLIIIDGVQASSGDLNAIDPEVIESFSVLKDATATALYGSRGANGVILITTKKGTKGRAKATLKMDGGFSNAAVEFRPTLNGEQRRELIYEGLMNFQQDEIAKNPEAGLASPTEYADLHINDYASIPELGYTDWRKELMRTAHHQSYEASVSGGNDKTTFYSSLGFNRQEGLVENSNLDRYTARLNVTQKVGSRGEVGANVMFSQLNQEMNEERGSSINPFLCVALNTTPSFPVRDAEGNYVGSYPSSNVNPLRDIRTDYNRTRMTRMFSTGYASIDIIKGLKLKETLSYDYNIQKDSRYWNPLSGAGAKSGSDAQTAKGFIEYSKLISSTSLGYNTTIAQLHHVDALVAYEIENYQTDKAMGDKSKLPSDYLVEPDNAASLNSFVSSTQDSRMISYVSRINYDYDDRYYIAGSFRRDGSSRLSPENRWGNFWSVSGMWNVGAEKFMQSIKSVLSDLKIRASYGVNGNQPGALYGYMGLYSYGQNYMGGGGSYESALPNPNLKWEKNYNLNLGLDLAFINRIFVSLEYYNRDTKDLLYNRPISSTTGFQNYLGNLGQLNNRGWELELRTINFAGNNFNWTSVLNMTHNKNKIVSLDGKLEQSIEGSWFIHKVGLPYSTFYVKEYAGVDPQTGKALYYMNTQDANGNYDKTVTTDASAAQAIPYKSVDPKISGGFTNIVNYKWFDLALTLTYSLGGYSFDKTGTYNETDGAKEQNYNLPIYELDRWQKPGDVTDVPRFVLGQAAGPQNSSRYVHSTDHLRVKNLTLGFTLPDQWLTKLGVSKARLYFSGSNLLTWAKWNQYDPEVPVSGEVFCETPPMRTYSFGIEVSF